MLEHSLFLRHKVRELERKMFSEAMADHGEDIRPSQMSNKLKPKDLKEAGAESKAETKPKAEGETKAEAKPSTDGEPEAEGGVVDPPEGEEEEEEPPTYEQLVALGNLYKTQDVLHARAHKRSRIEENERERAKAEAEEREAASKALQQHTEDNMDSQTGKFPKRVREVDSTETTSAPRAVPKQDLAIVLDLQPNTTQQARPTNADLHARVIRVEPHMVPPLCQLWTLRRCPKVCRSKRPACVCLYLLFFWK